MSYDIKNKLKIAVSTRALFALENENELFMEQGSDAYAAHQIAKENETPEKGAAFLLVRALLSLNRKTETAPVEVILVSKNSADTGLRAFNSIEHYGLDIQRGFFVGGADIVPYLRALDIDLFLTADEDDAKAAIKAGIPSASLVTSSDLRYEDTSCDQLRIAFDGDAVIFSEESEIIFKKEGLASFNDNEHKCADIPMRQGPLARFLFTLSSLQKLSSDQKPLIRTALITSRGAPSHKRVINTLREWNVSIDEIFFLGGMSKTQILKAFGAHIFFDDQKLHTLPASAVVPSGTVPTDIASFQ